MREELGSPGRRGARRRILCSRCVFCVCALFLVSAGSDCRHVDSLQGLCALHIADGGPRVWARGWDTTEASWGGEAVRTGSLGSCGPGGVPSQSLLPLVNCGGSSDGGERRRDAPPGLTAHDPGAGAGSAQTAGVCVPSEPCLGALGAERVVVCVLRGL